QAPAPTPGGRSVASAASWDAQLLDPPAQAQRIAAVGIVGEEGLDRAPLLLEVPELAERTDAAIAGLLGHPGQRRGHDLGIGSLAGQRALAQATELGPHACLVAHDASPPR